MHRNNSLEYEPDNQLMIAYNNNDQLALAPYQGNQPSLSSGSLNERESGFPRPEKYDSYYVNQYSIPKSLHWGKREDRKQRKRELEKNAFLIETPLVRRGIMGWKLSKIGEKEKPSNTSHFRGRRRAKKHRSAFRNVSQHILQSHKDNERNQSEEPEVVVVEQKNQIINLKAPTQFERDDYDIENRNDGADINNAHKQANKEFGIKKYKAKRRKGKDISKDFSKDKKEYLASFSYFGSRIHDKISEFNKMISTNNQKYTGYSQIFNDPRGDAFESSRIGSFVPESNRNAVNPKLKIDVPGIQKILETDSSKFMLTNKDVELKKSGALGVAASSVLMGDTSIFTPQSVILPKVRVGGHKDSYSDSI